MIYVWTFIVFLILFSGFVYLSFLNDWEKYEYIQKHFPTMTWREYLYLKNNLVITPQDQ